MPEPSFFNQVIDGVIGKMKSKVDAIMDEFPLPPGYEELKGAVDFVSWWNKAVPQQRAEIVARLGENRVMAMLMTGRGR